MTIGIHVGHGGPEDYGVIKLGEVESWLNNEVGLACLRECKSRDVPWVIDRTDDTGLTWAERREILADATCIVGIHHDSADDPTRHGCHVLHWPGAAPEVIEAAEVIQRYMPPELSVPRAIYAAERDKWPRAWNVLRAFPQPMLLVEVCYLSNTKDRHLRCKTPGVADTIAEAIVAGGVYLRSKL